MAAAIRVAPLLEHQRDRGGDGRPSRSPSASERPRNKRLQG
ncbi:MAG: hypothetical protein R3C69_08185 [Geminicoccaceae bacterium]